MSELDKYFPRLQNRPKPFIPSSRSPGCTNWPNTPEMYRETLDEWTDCQGFIPKSDHVKNKWESGTRDFVDEYGETRSPKLLRKAWNFYLDIEWEQRQRIIIETPRSLIAFARKVLEIEAHNKDSDDPEVRRRKALSWIDTSEAWWHE